MTPYKDETPLCDRKASAERLRKKHPGHVPVVMEPSAARKRTEEEPDRSQQQSHRCKFMVPAEYTVAHLVYMLRRRLQEKTADRPWLERHQAVFVFLADTHVLPPTSATLGGLDDEYRDAEDGMLYLCYAKEHTFGGATSIFFERHIIIEDAAARTHAGVSKFLPGECSSPGGK